MLLKPSDIRTEKFISLSASAKNLFMVLSVFADNKTQSCWPSLAVLESYMSKPTVIKASAELEELGFIKKKTRYNKSCVYTLMYPTRPKEELTELTMGEIC